MFRVTRGERSTRPSSYANLELSDEIWEVMDECWSHDPNERPTVVEVAQKLSVLSTKLTAERFLQSLERQAFEGEMATPLSFRAAMRGHDIGFSKDEIDLVREVADDPGA